MLTVNALVDASEGELSFIAGQAGGERLVTWAHAVDLADPWNWVAAGDLVMTTGAGLPIDPLEQSSWIRRLADAQVSALVIAPRSDAPAVTEAILSFAETKMLPILSAAFDLEFAKLARIVIESALQSQRDRLSASQRLFESYAAALRLEPTFDGRLTSLSRRLACQISIMDSRDGPVIASTGPREPSASALTIEVPGRGHAVVEVSPLDGGTGLDPLLVHHLAGLLGIELERHAIARDDERLIGEKTLVDLMTGSVDLATARPLLARRRLVDPLIVVVVQPSGTALRSVEQIHLAPGITTHAPLMFVDDTGVLIAIVPDDGLIVESLVTAAGATSSAGLSEPITAVTGVAEAVRQARLALNQGRERAERIQRYATDGSASGIAPTTVAQARGLVTQYLGAILSYDSSHDSSLLRTLETFLAHNGSWKETAQALHIHRQTLVYRLATVERLSGLKPNSTIGTASFWIALRAGRAADLLP